MVRWPVSAAESAIAEERQELLANAARSHQRLLEWAANCPENFDSRAAPSARSSPASRAANSTPSVCTTRRSDRRDEPLRPHRSACERAGRTFLRCPRLRDECDRVSQRGPQLLSALGCRRQGAATRSALSPPFPARTRIDSRSAISEHIERLELETVLKALQAVSGEIVLERVIETLLHLAIEHRC